MTVNEFWDKLFSIDQVSHRVDLILDFTAEAAEAGEFDKIEEMFETADVDKLTTTDLVCILTYTLWEAGPTNFIFRGKTARRVYKNRPAFIERVIAKLKKTETPERMKSLLDNLI
jgi:hypothetical protein